MEVEGPHTLTLGVIKEVDLNRKEKDNAERTSKHSTDACVTRLDFHNPVSREKRKQLYEQENLMQQGDV